MERCFDLDLTGILDDARADGNIMALLQGSGQLRNLVERRRAISVHKKHIAAPSVEHSETHRGSFAHVRTGESANPGVALFEEAAQGESFIPASVIGNNQFEIHSTLCTPTYRLEHGARQPRLLVVGGYHNRQINLDSHRYLQFERRRETPENRATIINDRGWQRNRPGGVPAPLGCASGIR